MCMVSLTFYSETILYGFLIIIHYNISTYLQHEALHKKSIEQMKEQCNRVKTRTVATGSSKWVFKIKGNKTENLRYKARLVARGYSQMPEVDFDETFAPVERHTSLRILFALCVKQDINIHQMDVITAFLQGDLEESIYMIQPGKK